MYSEKPKLHRKQREHKHGELRTIVLDTTSRCNMRCPHCYNEPFAGVKAVDLPVLQGAIDELHELGVYHYIFEGGEPVLEIDRLEAILGMCYPEETYLNVVSNGWDMSLENIRRLKKAQVDKISFSLDSGIEGEHDANRLNGSYKRTLEAIDNVLNEGLLASISIVVTHDSLYSEGFYEAYRYAQTKGIRFDTQIAEPVGKWDGKLEHLINEIDARYIKKLQKEGGELPNGQRIVNRDMFTGEFDHCPAVTEILGVTVDGQVLPCNFLQFSLGNIGDKSIRKMRDDALANKWFDGKHTSCLCGEDRDFIDEFIMPYVDEPKPLDAYEVFGL